jgi:hypothetical protein
VGLAARARAATVALLLALPTACGDPVNTGYWEGKGKASEIPMQDRFRKLTRGADYDFWFALDKQGNATGEIEITYNSELTVENLPSMSFGSVSFSPKVGGKITDLNPKRKFPLVGVLDGHDLTLEIATPESARPPIEFTIRADPGVSAGFGGMTMPGGAAGIGDTDVIRIAMKPFTPFNGAGKVEKRANGPYAASFEARGKTWSIAWSARQMGGEQREVKITPDMKKALERLRSQASRQR